MLRFWKIISMTLAAILLLAIFSSCAQNSGSISGAPVSESPFSSFRDIPGITTQEIAAIETLQGERGSFSYGMILTTEAFENEKGEVSGYAALVCEWLTGLFDVTFTPHIYPPFELFARLSSGELDFSGNVMPTEERMLMYNMTDTIAERQFVTVRLKGSRGFDEILQERPLRYVFIENTPLKDFADTVLEPGTYEPVWARNDAEAYQIMKRGEADAYITTSVADIYFIEYGDVIFEDFFPLLFNPVSVATANPDLEPIISVIKKAQRNGAMPYLNYLYNKGYQDYRRYAMSLLLNETERAYIASNPVIPIAAFNTNYPLSFWDSRKNEWQGVFFDVLDEITALTGLSFAVAHDETANMQVIYQMLEDGDALLLPNLAWAIEREEQFIWSEHVLLDDNLALISKSDFRNVTLNEILHVKVGVARGTIHYNLFNQWFPNHMNTVVFDGIDEALEALIRDEVDMVMTGQRRVLHLTHFQELPGYKANMVFNHPLVSRITFAGDQAVLSSIVDKALRMTDIDGIAMQWIQRTYDYRAIIAEGQRPWLIGGIILSTAVLVLLAMFLYRNRRMTAQINRQNDLLEDAAMEYELQLAKLNMVVKSTKIGLWDMEVVKDDPMNPRNHAESSSEFKQMLGFTDENDFPNLLGSWSDRLHPDDKENAVTEFYNHLIDKTGESTFDIEHRLLKKNGEYAYYRGTGETIRDEDGNPVHISGALIDISETKDSIFKNELQLMKQDLMIKATKIGLWDMEVVRDDPVNPKNAFTWSDELRHMLGYTGINDFPNILSSWTDCIHPDDAGKIVDCFERHIMDKTGQTPYDIEYRMYKKNGEYAYFRDCGDTIRDENGEPIHVAGALIDMTEINNLINEAERRRKEAEAAGAENELQLFKLNLVMKAANIGMVDMDLSGDNPLDPANPAVLSEEYLNLLGIEDGDAVPNSLGSWGSLVHPDDQERTFKIFSEHMFDKTGESSLDTELRVRRKDGEYVYLHTIGKAIRDEDGNAMRFLNCAIDMTETKNLINDLTDAVDEAQEATKVKNNSLSTLENILNNIDGQIYTTAPGTSRILFINDQLKSFFGIEGDSALGQHCYKVFRGRDSMCYNCPCIELEKNPDQTVVWEEYLPELDRYVRHSDRYIDWPDGKKVHLQLAVDITELVSAKEQAENQRMEAEAANKTKSEFLSHISHEIRTPMNAVIGTAEIQLQKDGNSPETEEAFNTIYTSGNLLLNIINDILDLSKIEAGKLELMPAHYDIPSLLYDTMQLNLLRYESKPIEFNLKIDERTPLDMYGDEMRIKQVLNNILSNAFKYTEKGEVELSVSAEILEEPSATESKAHTGCILILKVRDTGQGMSAKEINELFEEYTRFNIDFNRDIVGTGLGMSITKRLLDTMGGEIFVESELGKGSVFTVRLPQKRIGSAVCGVELAERLRSSRFKNTIKLNRAQIVHEYMPYGSVLIVDDVESNLYVAKGMMLPYGLKIETAASGYEAVDKVRNGGTYDIIFMDHMMPKMNGVETTGLLRVMGYKRPIVALTANAVAGSAEMFLSNGFDGYISKPIDIRELNASLNRLIRDKQPLEVVEAVRREMSRQTASGQKIIHNKAAHDELAAAVVLDIENALNVLDEVMINLNSTGDADMDLFATTVHGMKSALNNIGETELSGTAFKLEQAGDNGEVSVILSETPAFMDELKLLIKRFKRAEADAPIEVSQDDMAYLRVKLNEIKAACEVFNKKTAKTALDDLKQKIWPHAANSLLDEISVYLLRGEFKKVVTAVDKY
ncbi:MAG: PAS domain-containing protein [Defluviitaleaceae bacterium]|nr:PAS domain-containing protein [Defluviitaleaceae bacterium]